MAFFARDTSTKYQARPVADWLDHCLEPILAAQGFAASDMISAWPDIVGEEVARFSQPVKIKWPKSRGDYGEMPRNEPAILVVRVEPVFALDLQHQAPVMIERLNRYYGWRCVGRVTLQQGAVRRIAKTSIPQRILNEADARSVEQALKAIGDEALRGALHRLGESLLGKVRG
jgi:hypothetical protein